MDNRFVTQIRIDEQLAEKLKAIASAELRTLNAQMEYFLKKGVEQYERQQKIDSDFISGFEDRD